MFVFLSKFLPLWIYPIGLMTVLLVAALILIRRPRWSGTIIAVALAVILISGNRWVAVSLTRSLEWRYLPPEEIPTGEVIVVLGGGTHGADFPRSTVEVNGAADRILYAMRLYQQGAAPYLLLSGGYIEWLNDSPVSPAEDMAEIMTTFGIPEENIWLQPNSQNTYEDALYCAEILRERGINRVLLVTSAQHMPRSVALFEKQGLAVVPLPTDYTVTERTWQELTQPTLQSLLITLVPNVGNISMTTSALKEYIGTWMYGLQGWL